MEIVRRKESHVERTAAEPRESEIHSVTLSRIDLVSDSIRVFRLGIQEGSTIKFLPGQWLDTFVPGVKKPGGFTITSQPSRAGLPTSPYLELAVQKAPSNPAAEWLWDMAHVGSHLHVRVGGAFVWPPQGADLASLRRVVFVAAGVGVNPFMSILSHLAEAECSFDVRFLYSVKAPKDLGAKKMLFVERLRTIYGLGKVRRRLQLFLTGAGLVHDDSALPCNETKSTLESRRMTLNDVYDALGPKDEHKFAVVYLCGPPSMTDEFAAKLTSPDESGLDPRQVLCERWW
ncbi:NADH-cytochrome b-5 reductase [Colletotrichum sojae]|uniref:Oxidoreductase NAD-binding domain-containing protein 1 n=1 Tax=Colletotrichum sojae TaxID=2175907 RepID=A0A8H6MYY6_9PEZI|nr:NADH-cytochrome b-5 reductase [Colletotrichum sojae]